MEEIWFFLLVSVCICASVKSLFNLLQYNSNKIRKLPPGPTTIPILGNFLWLRKSFFDIESILRRLCPKYGPIITLPIGFRPTIFISNPSIAYQALVKNGATFADRPSATATSLMMNKNTQNISSGRYGSLWRVLRRNITSEIFHPSRVKSYGHARKWVLDILINKIGIESQYGEAICVIDHFQYAMFCLLVFMCFGEKLDEKVVRKIEAVLREALVNFGGYNVLNFWPKLGKIVLRNRWKELVQMRYNRETVLVPLIRARQEQKKAKQETQRDGEEEFVLSYVDTLVDLQHPDDGRKLNEDEMVTLCSEFLNAGTDTTSTALQWIMANLVKHQHIQAMLFSEIEGLVTPGEEIKEEDLQKMPYLKAVVLEGLRRHPPGHFVLPHTVTEDFTLEGYTIPKNAVVNFAVAEMGWDPKVWKDPMEFKPERFMSGDGEGDVFDITGSREIKMMPFGVGRRICPGLGLALLHLEYFVANLVRKFTWTAKDGDEVDLSEKQEFTIVMKNPLQAHISRRIK